MDCRQTLIDLLAYAARQEIAEIIRSQELEGVTL